MSWTKKQYVLVVSVAVVVILSVFVLRKTASESAPMPNSQSEAPTSSTVTRFKNVGTPLDSALLRITKKPFGIRVSPENSPVSPERFTGVHTGVDFEILPGEEDMVVEVHAICGGEIVRKAWGRGYGGYVVQACKVGGVPITVVYGHLALASIKHEVGDMLNRSETFAHLGRGFSQETDNERKHLHLGIHRGTSVVTNGYIASESGLEDWINVEELLR